MRGIAINDHQGVGADGPIRPHRDAMIGIAGDNGRGYSMLSLRAYAIRPYTTLARAVSL
jgi:hypothetical protein